MEALAYHPVPCQPLRLPEAEAHGISLSIVREDLNHPFVSGNKWWKLKDNLREARRLGHHTLLTFGGAHSNHIYATAAAARELGFASVGVIRGEPVHNATLQFAAACGMQLHFVSRTQYRNKGDAAFLKTLTALFGPCYILPEGGTNALAVQSCAEWGARLWQQHHPDVVVLPIGTGGTLAGLVCGLQGRSRLIGISVLKDGAFLTDTVARLIEANSGRALGNWHIETSFHGGGYGKSSPHLRHFIASIEHEHHVLLDPVYTGKLMWAVSALIREKYFSPGMRIFILHTGGLQGRQPE